MTYKKEADGDTKKLLEMIVKMKNEKMFPKGYASKIAKKLGLKSPDKVYQVSGGHHYHEAIADELLELAANNKIKSQIEKAKDILS